MKKFLTGILLIILTAGFVFADEQRLPGSSIAGARLQYDTLWTSVFPVVATIKPKCKVVKVINTEVTDYPEYNKVIDGKKYASSSWKELWTLEACKTDIYVPVVFIPDKVGSGTTFSVNVNDIKYEKTKR